MNLLLLLLRLRVATTTAPVDNSIPANNAAAAAAAAANIKRKPSRRANTAERRATHKRCREAEERDVERSILGLIILNRTSPSSSPTFPKSAVLPSLLSSIRPLLISMASRRHRMLASRELRQLRAEADCSQELTIRIGKSTNGDPARTSPLSTNPPVQTASTSSLSGELDVLVAEMGAEMAAQGHGSLVGVGPNGGLMDVEEDEDLDDWGPGPHSSHGGPPPPGSAGGYPGPGGHTTLTSPYASSPAAATAAARSSSSSYGSEVDILSVITHLSKVNSLPVQSKTTDMDLLSRTVAILLLTTLVRATTLPTVLEPVRSSRLLRRATVSRLTVSAGLTSSASSNASGKGGMNINTNVGMVNGGGGASPAQSVHSSVHSPASHHSGIAMGGAPHHLVNGDGHTPPPPSAISQHFSARSGSGSPVGSYELASGAPGPAGQPPMERRATYPGPGPAMMGYGGAQEMYGHPMHEMQQQQHHRDMRAMPAHDMRGMEMRGGGMHGGPMGPGHEMRGHEMRDMRGGHEMRHDMRGPPQMVGAGAGGGLFGMML
ncbi:hypothetical protein BKA70DRAFT_1462092 [Coprinopsis sp. MPI-PUGE-AT-0042]|nr:hypothetical protein BKA70DRAFT_1462092 [Coprinopsis sp. MPI-PUGE-AT-0042]